jgi:hypothetical protein
MDAAGAPDDHKTRKMRASRKSGRLSMLGLDIEPEALETNQDVADYYRTVVAPTVSESAVIDAPVDVVWEAIRLADFSWCDSVKGAAELQSGASLASIGSTRMVVWADNDQTWQLLQVSYQSTNSTCDFWPFTLLPLIVFPASRNIRY